MLYHYVYKTKHNNGRYYIGRHTTPDLNDGYVGSGVWVSGIKNKKDLIKEILHYTNSTQELKKLEEHLIAHHYNDPLCMNRGLGSNGWTSEEAKAENAKRLLAGTHNFLNGEIPKRTQLRRVANGTHPWVGQKNPSLDRIKNGTHLWLSDEHKHATSQNNKKRFSNGTHHFLTEIECPYCEKKGQMTAMKRWHFENCQKQ
jgi:hypothetical protein